MKKHHLKCLAFIATHTGTRNKAFLGGYRFRFDAPEFKRSPFRVTTLYTLIAEGYVTSEGPVTLTDNGRAQLNLSING